MEYKKSLRELRSKLVNNQMSVMVGAGFSKNVSTMFPSWAELLKDLLKESYGAMLEREYLLLPSGQRKKFSQDEYFATRCWELLAEKGYLEVVSDYIRSRSVEKITTYIEERTPQVSFDSGQLVLKMGNRIEYLDLGKLELHRMMVGLQWNNIYTTNYDHLLDVCVNDNQAAELKVDIDSLGTEINGLNLEFDLLEEKIALLDEKLVTLAKNVVVVDDSAQVTLDAIAPEKNSAEKDKIHIEKNELSRALKECRGRIELKQSQMEIKEQAMNACFNIVKSATKLRIKRNKNIIKLHGSLRSPQEVAAFDFGFDGDNRKQYVISAKDYRDYPQKHEAFTQLMRISLLQESFCLVGFSADDPNFLAWVSWVRDILQKEPPKGEPRPTKIYLIDVGGGKISVDRQLFLENYSIKRIALRDPEIRELLLTGCEPGQELESHRDYLFAFLSFLANDEHAEPAVPVADLAHVVEWKDIWKDRTSSLTEPKQNMDKIRANLDRLGKLNGKIHIAEIKYTHQQFSLLNFYMQSGKKHKAIDLEVMPLLVIAAKDTMLPLGYFFSPLQMSQLQVELGSDALMKRWHNLELVAAGNVAQDLTGGEKAYQMAFHFRFSDLKEFIDDWDAQDGELLKKAGLLSFLNVERGLDFLVSLLSGHDELDNELRLYLTEQRSFNRLSYNWLRDRKLARTIEAYKRQGFHSLNDSFAYLLEEMRPPVDKPRALGYGRFSVGRGNDVFAEQAHKNAIRFLFLLMESGFHLNLNQTLRLAVEEWYPVIHYGFEAYPAAFLFYGLQFSDDGYLKRLGQEYANSELISQQMRERLTRDLFSGIANFKASYRGNGYKFLSTFLTAVDPSVWEELFMEHWRKGLIDDNTFKESHHNPFATMAFTALKYISKGENILAVISDSLHALGEKENDIVIDYMYYLLSNNNYKDLDRQKMDFSQVDSQIENVIGMIDERHTDRLFSLTNLRKILSHDQFLQLKGVIAVMDYALVRDSKLWSVVSHFIADDAYACAKLKTGILANKQLWHTGKSKRISAGESSWSSSHPIELSRLTKSDKVTGLEWTAEELDVIYNELYARIGEIDEIMEFRDMFFDYVDLLEEIEWFLKRFSDQISGKPGYADLAKKAKEFHFWVTRYHSIPDGLISQEHANVVWALSEVGTMFYQDRAELAHIHMVINKVLFQVSPALEAAAGHLSSWMQRNALHNSGFWGMETALISILKKYRHEPVVDGDISYWELKLVSMAFDLESAGIKEEAVAFWIERGRSSHYNNVKQLVFRKTCKGEEDVDIDD